MWIIPVDLHNSFLKSAAGQANGLATSTIALAMSMSAREALGFFRERLQVPALRASIGRDRNAVLVAQKPLPK
jgi:hypothetical protein